MMQYEYISTGKYAKKENNAQIKKANNKIINV